ncbi:MAG: hypothetical protein JETT_0963 [Candidatus Jettenia ecosi]|uniref:Uncharacterized protein n=1 Tax=Candidatus Jettenia ecosi TaxID=2494326 RepID=A0A533QDD8_9BACT|nr:MAG: hypothetical protein JETT_0963 [Candidatus Jettenia ecosi]
MQKKPKRFLCSLWFSFDSRVHFMKEEKIMISGIIKKALDLAVGALFMTKEKRE